MSAPTCSCTWQGANRSSSTPRSPFAAYLDAAQTENPAARDQHLTRHARQPRTHVDQLADTTYWESFDPTPEVTWRHEALSQDAAKIHQLGRELYSRLVTVGAHLDRLGSQLGKAVDSFNLTVAAMESRVTVTARKLHDLDVFDGDLTEVSAVDSWPRRTNLEDLSGSTGHANEAS